MRRTRTLLAFLCITALMFAAIGTPSPAHFSAVLTNLWLFAPPVASVLMFRRSGSCSVQPASLPSLDASRAPPSVPSFA